MMDIGEFERHAAARATEIVRKAGGWITFGDYDALILRERPLFPTSWSYGVIGCSLGRDAWALNMSKVAIFAACQLGMIYGNDRGYVISSTIDG